MPTLLVSDLKEKTVNLKEDAYIANMKKDAVLLLYRTWRHSKSLRQFGDNLKRVYMIWKYA